MKITEVIEDLKTDISNMTQEELTLAASKETKAAFKLVWQSREFLVSPRQATSFFEFCSVFGATLKAETVPNFIPFPETPDIVAFLNLSNEAWEKQKQRLDSTVHELERKNVPDLSFLKVFEELEGPKQARLGRIMKKYIEAFQEIEEIRDQMSPTPTGSIDEDSTD